MSPRLLCAVRTLYGAGLLLGPRRALSMLARAHLDRESILTARVLGARQLVQAAQLWRRPTRRDTAAGAVVDALHCASMLAVGRLAPRALHRRLAQRDARSAGLLALAGVIACRRAG